MTEIPRRSPLLLFAVKYWSQFIHYADTGDSSSHGDKLRKAFSAMSLSNSRLKFIYFWCHLVQSLPSYYTEHDVYFPKVEMNALIIATFFDLRDFVFRLVNGNLIEDINFQMEGCGAQNQTALSIAVHCGYVIIARFLIKKGADINFRDNNGVTILALSARAGHINVCQRLLEKGINFNAKAGGYYGNALQA
jgi:hypothetical protein